MTVEAERETGRAPIAPGEVAGASESETGRAPVAAAERPPIAAAAEGSLESAAERLVSLGKGWGEAQTLAALLPMERAVEALRWAIDETGGARDLEARIGRLVDRVVARVRAEGRSAADVLGAGIVDRVVESAGAVEPDERAIRAFFEERAAHDLLGSVLYDGIVEFVGKANQVGEKLPGVSAAKKLAGGVGGFLGSLGGGLAGAIAGGVKEELERRLEDQVRQFLAGFGKVAVDRAVRFATSPQNRAAFRDMRRNLVRRLLTTPVKDLASGLGAEQTADLKRRLCEAARAGIDEERRTGRLRKRIEEASARHGGETFAALVTRLGGELLPAGPVARLFGPALGRFLATDGARAALRDAIGPT